MEAEVRAILQERFPSTPVASGLGTRIHDRVARLGGIELESPDRSEVPRAAEFDE